ncbi:hypothetical protein B0H11DRAFT_562434 [Mycena galericulata]|nr:hypothetical protein B0H11DRAFT_562434 [Mycena galericulata]
MLPLVRFLTLALAAVLVVANTAEPPVTYLPNRVHLAGLLKRKAGLTHDQFLTYMTAHAELLRSTNVTKYFTKYDVVCSSKFPHE